MAHSALLWLFTCWVEGMMAFLDVPGILCLMWTSLRIAHITSGSSWSDLNHTQSVWSGQDHTGHMALDRLQKPHLGPLWAQGKLSSQDQHSKLYCDAKMTVYYYVFKTVQFLYKSFSEASCQKVEICDIPLATTDYFTEATDLRFLMWVSAALDCKGKSTLEQLTCWWLCVHALRN